MDYIVIFKTFGDVVKDLSPEFKEKHLGKITASFVALVAIPAVAECVKYCADRAAYCCCFKAAAENGQLPDNALNTSETTLIGLPKTA